MASFQILVAVSTLIMIYAAATATRELEPEVKELKQAQQDVVTKEQMLHYDESDIQDSNGVSLATSQALFESLFNNFNVSYIFIVLNITIITQGQLKLHGSDCSHIVKY